MANKVRPASGFYDLTPKELVERLRITHMTLNNWQKGSSKTEPLPVKHIPLGKSHRVLIDERKLVKWLREFRPELVKEWTRHERKRKAA